MGVALMDVAFFEDKPYLNFSAKKEESGRSNLFRSTYSAWESFTSESYINGTIGSKWGEYAWEC